jgi:hypothetical protein
VSNSKDVHPYHHEHTHVEEIPWSRLGGLLTDLVERINLEFRPEIVVGIAKGGVIPAVYAASAISVDFFPIKLSSRHNERVVSDTPAWHVYPTDVVRGRRVLLFDDISVAGRTLGMARAELFQRGAAEIRTATIAVHEDSVRPDFFALRTDALIVWPWDRDMLRQDGTWYINPEYQAEMDEIPGYAPTPSPGREAPGRWR